VNLPAGALIADGMLQLLPTLDALSSDGFFAAVMVRDAAAVDAVVEGDVTDAVEMEDRSNGEGEKPVETTP
jgi:hypothetical protein